MTECPACGFIPTKSNRSLLRLHSTYFPDVPIIEMQKRGWIQVQDLSNLEEILFALMEFLGCGTVDEFKLKMGYEGELLTPDLTQSYKTPEPERKDEFFCLTPKVSLF